MENIAPYPETFILPKGCVLPVYAADQPQYNALPCIKTPDGKVVSQWKPDEDELKKILAGEPITLIIWTFNQRLQPLWLGVGGCDLTEG